MINKNLILTGDLHIKNTNPKSRIDDYPSSIEDKLRQILDMCLKIDADLVIPGDIFDSIRVDNEFLVWVVGIFAKFKENGVKVITIRGNHDIYRSQNELENKSPLKILEKAKLVEVLSNGKYLTYNNITIYGFGYYDIINKPVNEGNSLLICHKFVEQNSFKEFNINIEDMFNLGYTHCLAGHDHVPYPTIEEPVVVFRPGSIGRGTAHDYNFKRGVQVVALDTTSLQYKEVPLIVKPFEEIISEEVITNKNNKDEISNMFGEYTEYVERIVSNSEEVELDRLINKIREKKKYSNESRELLVRELIG